MTIDELRELNKFDLVYNWNYYCEDVNDMDRQIFPMDEFEELVSGMKPLEIALKIFYGDFNPNDDFFYFNGYANFESTNYPEEHIDLEELSNWMDIMT